MGRYALAGLVGCAALILLYVGAFSDSLIRMYDPASSAVVQASMTEAAVTEARARSPLTSGEDVMVQSDLLREPPSLGKLEQVAVRELAGDDVGRQGEAATVEVPVAAALPATPVHREKRGWGHYRAGGRPIALPHGTQSSRGTWLWPINMNGGG